MRKCCDLFQLFQRWEAVPPLLASLWVNLTQTPFSITLRLVLHPWFVPIDSLCVVFQFDATLDVLSSIIVLWRYRNAAAVHSAHREYMWVLRPYCCLKSVWSGFCLDSSLESREPRPREFGCMWACEKPKQLSCKRPHREYRPNGNQCWYVILDSWPSYKLCSEIRSH